MNDKTSHSENVDLDEIRKFSDLASRWWDPQSEFKPLHQINPLRLDYINQHSPVDGKTVLDVGCGGGILSESMAKAGATVTGIDMGDAPLNVARLHALETQIEITYEKIPAEQLAADKPEQWDIVTCMEMLEHVPDPSSIVQACYELVKPGGTVYFSTLNRNPKSFLFAIVGAEYILNILPKGTHQYEKFIRPSELHGWCETSGLETLDLTGLHYNPILQSYRLGPGLDVNYMAYTVKKSK